MNQKQIKMLKKQIVDESALNVGYYEAVIPEIIENIDSDAFYELMGKSSGEWLLEAAKSNNRVEFENILVSEMIKNMSYSDFKNIAHYFFGYQQNKEEFVAKSVEWTNGLFIQFQNDTDNILGTNIKKEIVNMDNSQLNNMEIMTKNFEATQILILDNLRLAQDIFKENMLKKSPTEIFDNASKIIYVGDALFELEGFVEDFTTDEYRERMYSYDKQMAALFERFYMDLPQDSSETFILAAENSYYKTDENYEIGSDDKSYFMENYIADYFELKPYLESYESKTKTSKSFENIAETSGSIKIKGI